MDEIQTKTGVPTKQVSNTSHQKRGLNPLLKRGAGLILLTLLVEIVVFLYLYENVSHHKSINPNKSTVLSTTKVSTTPTPSPVVFENTSGLTANYTGTSIYGFTLNFPKLWSIQYKITPQSDYKQISFDIAPAGWKIPDSVQGTGWSGWGILDIEVYSPVQTIHDWMDKYLPEYADKITPQVIRVGNRNGYELDYCSDSPPCFTYRVVLGRNYSYAIFQGNQNETEPQKGISPFDLFQFMNYIYFQN